MFFNCFPAREFSTSTLRVNQIESSMFMDMLSCNMQSNYAIQINGGWQCNVVIHHAPRGGGDHRQYGRRNACRVQLEELVFACGLGLKKDHQICYGLYDVDSKWQLYNSCCCILSILISLSHLEKNLLYKQLLYGCEISDLITLAELGNLYKIVLEIGDGISSSDYPVIYNNWLNPLGYEHMMIYDSQTGDGVNLVKSSFKLVFLGLNNSYYCSILGVGKFLYYEKVNYCV